VRRLRVVVGGAGARAVLGRVHALLRRAHVALGAALGVPRRRRQAVRALEEPAGGAVRHERAVVAEGPLPRQRDPRVPAHGARGRAAVVEFALGDLEHAVEGAGRGRPAPQVLVAAAHEQHEELAELGPHRALATLVVAQRVRLLAALGVVVVQVGVVDRGAAREHSAQRARALAPLHASAVEMLSRARQARPTLARTLDAVPREVRLPCE